MRFFTEYELSMVKQHRSYKKTIRVLLLLNIIVSAVNCGLMEYFGRLTETEKICYVVYFIALFLSLIPKTMENGLLWAIIRLIVSVVHIYCSVLTYVCFRDYWLPPVSSICVIVECVYILICMGIRVMTVPNMEMYKWENYSRYLNENMEQVRCVNRFWDVDETAPENNHRVRDPRMSRIETVPEVDESGENEVIEDYDMAGTQYTIPERPPRRSYRQFVPYSELHDAHFLSRL